MEFCTPQPTRRHNPVDSICRKLQTIQWRGEREPNTPFQIPKFSTSSYDSPHSGLRNNLEALLKKGVLYREKVDEEKEMGMPSSAAAKKNSMGPSTPMATPSTPNCEIPTAANVTYSVTSTPGERKGADGSDIKPVKTWKRYCSTPTSNSNDSPYFAVTCGLQPDSVRPNKSPPLSRTLTPFHTTTSYSLNFSSGNTGNMTENEVPYPALVVKRLSMGDGGISSTSENKRGTMAEISLICEENLLDTIFHACDTQRRGKVYVSHIVDYLRHTTSRTTEDSGLEELCNMLDPEHKDVSIDLDTYHAVMREWIDDCRNNGEETAEESAQESVTFRDSISAKRSILLNMTSGSWEAFGGEVSRAEFETSELVYCVTDLQMNNQKLQDEVKKLKQVVESMEDTNQKLAEENEELRNQARINQQLIQKEKMLEDEVDEMKATLSCTEEGRARASAHSKHVERENQSLIARIASLQEENFKVTMETDELQKRVAELCDINSDLQVQIHSLDGVVSEKEAVIREKLRQIDEFKATVEEYASITELLRVDKSKLESQMQMLHPDLIGDSLSLSVAYRLNQSTSGSLQTELALAQSPLEPLHGVDHLSTTMSLASPFDETLDKEVLLMMQGPDPEHMALEFKNVLNKLKHNFREETDSVLFRVHGLLEDHTKLLFNKEDSLQAVRAELDTRRADWAHSLDQLAQYTDSLEKELIKMASNMRRSRTEILHLSVRVQEQENQKRQLCEELEQFKTPQDSREPSRQTPAPEEEPGEDLDWDEELVLQDYLKSKEVADRYCSVQVEQTNSGCVDAPVKLQDRGEGEEGDEKWTVVDTAGDADVKDKSTPPYMETQPRQEAAAKKEDSGACTEPVPQVNDQSVQDKAALPPSAHSQAVIAGHPEADALAEPSHSKNNSAEATGTAQTLSGDLSQKDSPEKVSGNSPTTADRCEPPGSTSPAPETVNHNKSSPSVSTEDHIGEEKDEVDLDTTDMSRTKSLSQEKSERAAAEDSTSLLPVLVEEEESMQESSADASTTTMGGGSTWKVTSDPNRLHQGSPKKDSQPLSDKNKEQAPSHSIEAINKHSVREDRSQTSAITEKETEASLVSDANDSYKDDKNSLTPSDKEVEAEFQRLALGFKCDMFTLEKRLRLEQRSRDLAEENVRKEISSCQGLLQALIPLCEDDNQSTEIIQRLQKNLEILIQSMTRVSSRSEMLGAIHQESRISKAVEVMIQHVENLRRMYTKEHAELLELRETMMQNERSFGSQTEKDDFRGKKQVSSQFYKPSVRRVSIAAIPRSGGGSMHFDMGKAQDGSETDSERLTRRSPCPSPSSSPTSTEPGVAHSLSRSLGPSRASAAVTRSSRGVWLWLAMFVLLAGLLALLASLVMQPAVDAAPVGTGDSWMTIQQLLWPYTGLRHNGQPPV